MPEELAITGTTKEEQYQSLLPQLESLLEGETDQTAALANTAAALAAAFRWWWTGFYIVKESQLVLGPFQGPIACARIARGKGVCGAAWAENRTILVPDVEKFPGHIACSSQSRSEIVVPIHNSKGQVAAVLDVDSERLGAFDQIDARYLQQAAAILAHLFP